MQSDELAERLKAEVDVGETGQIIGQPNGPFEQDPASTSRRMECIRCR